MRKYFLLVFILFFVIALRVSALSPFDITYPIPELGNCANQAECKTYCDETSHADACLNFAQKYGFVDAKKAEQVKKLPATGPGGCKGQDECMTYCDAAEHADECLKFAEDHNLLDKTELKEAKAAAKLVGPGGCKGPKECKDYCQDPSHKEECFSFAKQKGLISGKQANVVEKVLKDGGPGGCKSEDGCRTYCQDANHLDECVEFGRKNGFISDEDAAHIKKAGFGKPGPGGCRGEECKTYCEDTAHQDECLTFAEKNGFMTKEQADQARKFANQTGPGGCKGDQCKEFCSDPTNAQTCLEFAQKQGLISKEDAGRAKKFLDASAQGGPGGCKGQECRDYCQVPDHTEECIAFAKKNGLLRPEEEKQLQAGNNIRQTIQESGGPGGCKSEEECRTYCTDPEHVEECVAFGSAHGGVPPEQAKKMLQQFQQDRFAGQGEFHSQQEFQQLRQQGEQRFEEFRQLEQQFRQGQPSGSTELTTSSQDSDQLGNRPPSFGPNGQAGTTPHAVGPGGCTSSAECIKYCTGHKEECFQGQQAGGGDQSQAQFKPQLRADIFKSINSNELPVDFQQKSEEERRQIFKQQFYQQGGQSGSSEGQGQIGRPGQTPADQTRTQNFGRCMQEVVKGGASQDDANKKCGDLLGRPPENFKGPQGQPSDDFQQGQNQFQGKQPEFNQQPNRLLPTESQNSHSQGMMPAGQSAENRQPFQGIRPVPGTKGIFSPLENKETSDSQAENFRSMQNQFHSSQEGTVGGDSQHQQFQQQGVGAPPPGQFHQPSGTFQPSQGSGFQQQPGGFNSQPPSGGFQPHEGSFQPQQFTPPGGGSGPSGGQPGGPPPGGSGGGAPPSGGTPQGPPPTSGLIPATQFFAGLFSFLGL